MHRSRGVTQYTSSYSAPVLVDHPAPDSRVCTSHLSWPGLTASSTLSSMMSNSLTLRPSGQYDAFDTITEPGRRPIPVFLRRTKTRRTRVVFATSITCVLLLVWGWRSSGIGIVPKSSRLATTNLPATPQTPISADLVDQAEAPLLASPIDSVNASINGLAKTSPSFHLLIPASRPSTELCKTLLSAFVLGYPAPTLVNWGKEFKDKTLDGEKIFEGSGGRSAKIRGVFDFLNDATKVKDDDLVLIVDGYDVWFQLPPKILIDRYHTMIQDANKRLRGRYGMVTENEAGDDGVRDRIPKYTQSVIFGADKICWPNPAEDPACTAVPYSALPRSIYGPGTDKDPKAYLNRPRWLNSGNVIGPVKDVRAIYEAAVHKSEGQGKGDLGDQFVLGEIFGEQEFQRETMRQASQGQIGDWLEWLSGELGTSDSPLSANITIKNMTTVPGHRYEFSLGLDYESKLFQTMTHSIADVDFITYNSSSYLASIQAAHPSLHSRPLYFPKDLQSASPPFSYASPGNNTSEADPSKKTFLLPYSSNLDTLHALRSGDSAEDDSEATTWRTLPLATNIRAASIPALLHINGDKTLLTSWWPQMWYHSNARALLRRFVRSTQGLHAATAAAKGGEGWWDTRGGRGGVWTDNREWKAWQEVCPGVEEEVFGDGKGVWAKEEGDGRRVNSFGKVIIGEDEEA